MREWIGGMVLDGLSSEKKKITNQGRHQQLLTLFVVLTVFCVLLFVIRFEDAKSNAKQVKLNKKV